MRRFAAAVAIAICACLACLAIHPVSVQDIDAGLGVPAAGDADPACFTCLAAPDEPGPGCATQLAACQADPQCAQALACAAAKNCFASGSLGAIGVCGLPCITEAGVISFDTPPFELAVSLFQCVSGACGLACHLTGDGGP
jgi:hypothetical protein